jgi:hypothetical protein
MVILALSAKAIANVDSPSDPAPDASVNGKTVMIF